MIGSAFETARVLAAYQQVCEDRVAVVEAGERTVIVVADGAGGIGSGEQAAEAVIREVKAAVSHTSTPEGWAAILRQTDFRLGDGEAAVVVVDLRPEGIYGASVGDCQAWVLNDGAIINLTASQRRKPLLGTGKAQPMGFSGGSLQGVLIVATDGFCNYVKPASIGPLVTPAESALTAEFQSLPRALLSLVRLKSGELWDDVGLVVCRKQRARRTRKRYEVLD